MTGPLIVGVVLAGGESSRMGRSKALLRCPPRQQSFLACTIETLREGGLADIAVVGRPSDDPLRAELRRIDGSIPYLVNPEPEKGQLSSLLVGVAHAESRSADAILVLPVDIPLVRFDTVALLVDAFVRGSRQIVRAAHRGRHGHPVIFPSSSFEALKSADPSVGAKSVLRQRAASVRDIEVDDPGVIRDVDRPEDYRELFNADPQ